MYHCRQWKKAQTIDSASKLCKMCISKAKKSKTLVSQFSSEKSVSMGDDVNKNVDCDDCGKKVDADGIH
jgi:hypothetical protein